MKCVSRMKYPDASLSCVPLQAVVLKTAWCSSVCHQEWGKGKKVIDPYYTLFYATLIFMIDQKYTDRQTWQELTPLLYAENYQNVSRFQPFLLYLPVCPVPHASETSFLLFLSSWDMVILTNFFPQVQLFFKRGGSTKKPGQLISFQARKKKETTTQRSCLSLSCISSLELLQNLRALDLLPEILT